MKTLEEIIQEYEELRENYRSFSKHGDHNRDALLEYQQRFIDLKSDLRPYHTQVLAEAERRSDKAATAIKYRISAAMMRDEYEFEDEPVLYEVPPTITHADKYAAASKKYKTFLDQRVFYRESLTNIIDLREDMTSYINNISKRIN